jgi:hypothetical protein
MGLIIFGEVPQQRKFQVGGRIDGWRHGRKIRNQVHAAARRRLALEVTVVAARLDKLTARPELAKEGAMPPAAKERIEATRRSHAQAGKSLEMVAGFQNGKNSACVTSDKCATFQSQRAGHSPSRRVGNSS